MTFRLLVSLACDCRRQLRLRTSQHLTSLCFTTATILLLIVVVASPSPLFHSAADLDESPNDLSTRLRVMKPTKISRSLAQSERRAGTRRHIPDGQEWTRTRLPDHGRVERGDWRPVRCKHRRSRGVGRQLCSSRARLSWCIAGCEAVGTAVFGRSETSGGGRQQHSDRRSHCQRRRVSSVKLLQRSQLQRCAQCRYVTPSHLHRCSTISIVLTNHELAVISSCDIQ